MSSNRFPWLASLLAILAFLACLTAFVWQLISYQKRVETWAKSDLDSRAALTASTLAQPLQTLDFKALHQVADRLKADGLRLRITQGRDFFVSEGEGRTGFFDTRSELHPSSAACHWSVVRAGDFSIGLGRPVQTMRRPFHGALVVAALAGLVGICGVVVFFVVLWRQRLRIRELARLEKFRREFIADISHEIKTPLTGILGAAEMLEGTSPLIPMIRREADRLNRLVQQILDLARLEREEDVLHLTTVDVCALAEEMAKRHALPFHRVDKDNRPLLLEGDAQLIEEALSNLIENAKRHSGTTDIALSCAVGAHEVRLIVEDHGIGIPPEEMLRVFERFHRVDPARAAESGGAGLGLAIVARIAHLHGGTVRVTAAEPHGCRFEFVLPRP